MADNTFAAKDYTTVNFAAVGDLISEWNSTVGEFQGAYLKASDDATFKILASLELCGDFPARFDAALESLVTDVNAVIAGVDGYIAELKAQDESLAGLFPPPPGGKKGGGKSGGSGSSEQEFEATGELLLDNSNEQLEFFKDMSLSDLSEVLAILKKEAQDKGISIEELLSNEEYCATLKDMFSKNENLSSDYKLLIDAGSQASMVTALKSLIKGECKEAIGLNSQDTSLTVKSMLVNIAKQNNVEFNDLLEAESNKQALSSGLSGFKKLNGVLSSMSQDDVQSKLLAIYDGNKLDGFDYDDNSQDTVRSQIDILSSLTGISYEELLNTPDYGAELYKSVDRLQRALLFADALSSCSDAGNVLASLMK